MPLTKSRGNMYDWVTHTHSHLGGQCTNQCDYCYVQAMERRFNSGKYAGKLRLLDNELNVAYNQRGGLFSKPRTIFVEHCNDLCCDGVADKWIYEILQHCIQYPIHHYVFQTRNPERLLGFELPQRCTVGTTIETDDADLLLKHSKAPPPKYRASGLRELGKNGIRTFLTIEPIVQFDLDAFVNLVKQAKPLFVNIGADSKNSGLPEPTQSDVLALATRIQALLIEVHTKSNLKRIVNPVQ